MGIGYGLAMGLGSGVSGFMQGQEAQRQRQFEEARALESERLRKAQQEAFLQQMADQQRRGEITLQSQLLDRGQAAGLTPDVEGRIESVERSVSGVSPFAAAGAQAVGAIQRRNLGAGQVTQIGPSSAERLDLRRRQDADAARVSEQGLRRDISRAGIESQEARLKADAERRDRERAEDRANRIADRNFAAGLQRELVDARQSAPTGPGRIVPAGVVQNIATNERQLAVLTEAERELAANPDAVGMQNYLPGALIDRLPGRGNRGGVAARAPIADIGSMEIRDRSGAAVTASEFPRLRPFIPADTDPPDVVRRKLARMRQVIQDETNALRSYYSADQGFAPVPQTSRADAAGATALDAEFPGSAAKIREARSEGYSDDEIRAFLSSGGRP